MHPIRLLMRKRTQPTSLPLDLIPRPARRLDRAVRVVAVHAHLLDHVREPVLAEASREFAVGEGLGEIAVYALAVV